MSKIISLFFINLFSIYLTQAFFLNHDYIDSINKVATTWKAGVNFNPDTPKDSILRMLGSKEIKDIKRVNAPYKTSDPSYVSNSFIPKSFDARERWPSCPTIKEVRNQGNCGNGWAFSSTGAFADRICIATDGQYKKQISAEHLTFCCKDCGNGCNGGYAVSGWWYFLTYGIVSGGGYNTTDGCQPYGVKPCIFGTEGNGSCSSLSLEKRHECLNMCYGDQSINYEEDQWQTTDYYYLDYSTIQNEVLSYGPAAAWLKVYDDFPSYKSGVYTKTKNASYLGYHDVKLIGWGVEEGVDYWLMMNSWGTSWGDNGLFKIRKGTNECLVDEWMSGGVPELDRPE